MIDPTTMTSNHPPSTTGPAPQPSCCHRLLRKTAFGEWDSGFWTDGPAPAELIKDCAERPDLYRVETAYTVFPANPEADVGAAPKQAISKLLIEAMGTAVSNGANSVSMPDHLVEVAAWLAEIPRTPAPPREFPPRILKLLHEVACRKPAGHFGPWEDGQGEPLQDDADAALSWIAAFSMGIEAALSPADNPLRSRAS